MDWYVFAFFSHTRTMAAIPGGGGMKRVSLLSPGEAGAGTTAPGQLPRRWIVEETPTWALVIVAPTLSDEGGSPSAASRCSFMEKAVWNVVMVGQRGGGGRVCGGMVGRILV